MDTIQALTQPKVNGMGKAKLVKALSKKKKLCLK